MMNPLPAIPELDVNLKAMGYLIIYTIRLSGVELDVYGDSESQRKTCIVAYTLYRLDSRDL